MLTGAGPRLYHLPPICTPQHLGTSGHLTPIVSAEVRFNPRVWGRHLLDQHCIETDAPKVNSPNPLVELLYYLGY